MLCIREKNVHRKEGTRQGGCLYQARLLYHNKEAVKVAFAEGGRTLEAHAVGADTVVKLGKKVGRAVIGSIDEQKTPL